MQVSPHVHALRIPFQVPLGPGKALERFVYAWLVAGDRICLIDSGVAGAERMIFEYIERIGRRPEEVTLLALTHAHPDHIGAAMAIRAATGCAVAAHPAERAWIEDVDLQCRQRPVPGFQTLVAGSVRVDQLLQGGQALDLGGGLRLEVIDTPGHSAGSVSLLLRPDGVLISGDAIPMPKDLPIWEDFAASVRSVEALRAVAGVCVLLASWDEPHQGEAIRLRMDEGLAWLRRVAEATKRIAAEQTGLEPMDLCRRVVAELGLPPVAANPLVARSMQACLRAG